MIESEKSPLPSPLLLPLLLIACHSSSVLGPRQVGDTEAPMDSGAGDTAPAPVDTADLVGSPYDSGAGPLDGLCTLELRCEGEILDDPRTTCAFSVRDAQGYSWYEGPAGVELRGRSSQGFPKKQYSVELWDEQGEDLERDLLGMGADEDWVLNGAYIDRAFIRNKLAFDLFQAFGGPLRYAPETACCTLTLDDEWLGIYFLSERIKRDDDRIDIQADTTERGESFVVKLDDSAGVQDNSSIGHGAWRLVYPPEEQASLAAQAGVQAWLQGWQAAYGGADPGDTDSGIFAWVDMDSAVDFVILQEFMKNNDAYYLSVHLWKDVDGVMYFTPWDMDLTLGQPLYNDNSLSNEWILYRPTMIDGMTAVGAFGEALQARWWELRQGLLAEDTLLQRLDGYRALMGDVVYENFQVWPIEDIQFSGDQLPVVASFDEEWERVRVWISERLAWVDDNISEY